VHRAASVDPLPPGTASWLKRRNPASSVTAIGASQPHKRLPVNGGTSRSRSDTVEVGSVRVAGVGGRSVCVTATPTS
jgi:hypothetical protein